MLILISCENAFTTVKEIDIPEHESKMSIFAELNSNDGSFFISKSKKIDDNTDQNIITIIDATISILENGNEFIKFQNDTFPNIDRYKFGKALTPGNEYKLIVENDEFGTATSSQVMPSKTEILDASYVKDGIVSNGGYTEDKFTIEFQDDKNSNNYYFLELLSQSIYESDTFENSMYLFNEFNGFGNEIYFAYKDGIAFDDKTFNGTKTKLIFSSYYYGNDDNKIKVKLHTITKEFYNFLVSYTQNLYAGDNPFAEPVIITNNIENGYGLFSLSNISEIEIEAE